MPRPVSCPPPFAMRPTGFEELQQGQRGQAERESGFLDCQAWQETALLRWIKPSRRDADGLLALRLVGLSRRDRRLRRRETFGADFT